MQKTRSQPRRKSQPGDTRPRWDCPSPTLSRFASLIAEQAPGPVLDIPCGYGRNAVLLASLGCEVICVDNDPDAVRAVNDLNREFEFAYKLHARQLDITTEPLPITRSSLGAVINVHFVLADAVPTWLSLLRPGGFIYIETFDDRGENYLSLPRPRQYAELLHGCELLFFQEKQSKHSPSAVTTRVLAQVGLSDR